MIVILEADEVKWLFDAIVSRFHGDDALMAALSNKKICKELLEQVLNDWLEPEEELIEPMIGDIIEGKEVSGVLTSLFDRSDVGVLLCRGIKHIRVFGSTGALAFYIGDSPCHRSVR